MDSVTVSAPSTIPWPSQQGLQPLQSALPATSSRTTLSCAQQISCTYSLVGIMGHHQLNKKSAENCAEMVQS